MISLFLFAAATLAAPQQVDAGDTTTALASIDECKSRIVPSREKYVVGTCSSEWHGIRYQMMENWRFEITVPASDTAQAANWTIMCLDDRVEDIKTCSLLFGQDGSYLHVTNWPLGDTLSWGGKAYPGTFRVARLGDGTPTRLPESQRFTSRPSALLLSRMHVAQYAIFRWYPWPSNLPADIDVDLAKFADLNIFLDAVAVKFRASSTGTGR